MSSVAIQRLLAELREQGVTDQRTLDAIAAVPREAFVPPTFAERAWDNTALPIGFGLYTLQLIADLVALHLRLDRPFGLEEN